MAAKHVLDIFRLLAAANRNDQHFYDGLSEKEREAFTPLTVMRWLSATEGGMAPYYLMATNDWLNKRFWSLDKHPELQWRLMAKVGVGTKQKHIWIDMPKRRHENKINEFLLQWWPGANADELALLLNQLTAESFTALVHSTGATDDEARPLIAEFERLHGSTADKGSSRIA